MKNLLVAVFLLVAAPASAWDWGSGYDEGDVPATRVKTATTNFNGSLSSADTTVQKALDTLDNASAGAAASITSGTNPTVDASGEIAEDTTVAGQLVVGANADVHSPIRTVSIPLENPSDTQNILLGKLPYGIVIQSITCGCDPADTGESVVIDVQERDATGDTPATADATITCDNDGAADDGTLSNATFDSGDWWSLDIGTVTGTVSNAFVTIKYKVVRE